MIATWFLIAGALLILMALVGSAVDRLPLSSGLIYLLIGVALGPTGFGIIYFAPESKTPELRIVCEIALLISLFTVGLKLRVAPGDPIWRIPLRLATLSMIVCTAAIALVGFFGFGLSLGAAILLGAILAPTDPVLASDVQVEHADDRNRTRFALTAEGGLNDGTALPFVLLGLGLLGLYDIGSFAMNWITVHLVWAVVAGLGVGWLSGHAVGRLVLYVRRTFQEAVGWEEFLTLGLVALSYGVALLIHANGFLAVLAAGLALRRIETLSSDKDHTARAHVAKSEQKTHPATAPAHMVGTVLGFNEKFERIGELVVVLALGASLSTVRLDHGGLWLALVLFVLIRPLSVIVGLAGSNCPRRELKLISWFGIRGIGSFYYLMYAVEAGVDPQLAEKLVSLVLTVVAASIAVHGISATPLMKLAARRKR